MIYGSVCSGIESASVAWHPLGWRPEFFSEIEPFPNAVLKARWPEIPNLGDMTKFKEWNHGSIDLLVGGTPCQSFSVAGLRKGLADPRGNLALTFLAIIDRARPRWVVWENVPGVLSSWSDEAGSFVPDHCEGDNDGKALGAPTESGFQTNDFDTFTTALRELGYGVAWRILDAQYIGVPQRRRRVFVVGYLGDWRRAAAVLFESQSLSWDPPPSRAPGKGIAADVAPSLTGSGRGVQRTGESRGQDPVIASCLTQRASKGPDSDTKPGHLIVHALTARHDSSPDGSGHGTPIIPIQEIGKRTRTGGQGQNGSGIGIEGDPMFTLQAGAQHAIYDMRGNGDGNTSPTLSRSAAGDRPNDFAPMIFETRVARNGRGAPSEIAPALKAETGRTGKGDSAPIVFSSKDHGADAGETSPTLRAGAYSNSHANSGVPPAVTQGAQVRRLTPRECERLQGFPDDYTLVPYRGRAAADGPRYKAIGNSMASVVMAWIGKRIAAVDAIK